MKPALRIAALAALATVLASPVSARTPSPYRLVVDKEKSVCAHVLRVIARLPREDLTGGKLSEASEFSSEQWTTTSVDWTDTSGFRAPREFRYRLFDIDNDGETEVVISYSWLLRSALHETWEILSPTEFSARQRTGVTWDTYYPKRLTERDVDFSDREGRGLTLAFMAPLTYANRNYVIYQDVQFGSRDPADGRRYLLVTEYQKDPYQDGGRWVPMKVVCAIRDR
jgi:hypothetical protein